MGQKIKVVFFGQSGPFSAPALRGLLRLKSDQFEFCAVVQGVRRPIGGAPHAWSRPSRLRPRRILGGQNLCDVAVAAGIPVLVTADVNAGDVASELRRLEPDVLVCVGFHCLFERALLEVPRLMAVNVHPSLLPRWRGPSPIFWMLKAQESKLGITLHCLNEGEDAGDILWQAEVDRPAGLTGGELYALAAEGAVEALGAFLNDPLGMERVPQGARVGPRARRPTPEDAEVDPKEWGCEALADFATGAHYFRQVILVIYGDRYPVKSVERIELGESLPGDWLEVDDLFGVRCRDGTLWLKLFES